MYISVLPQIKIGKFLVPGESFKHSPIVINSRGKLPVMSMYPTTSPKDIYTCKYLEPRITHISPGTHVHP